MKVVYIIYVSLHDSIMEKQEKHGWHHNFALLVFYFNYFFYHRYEAVHRVIYCSTVQ